MSEDFMSVTATNAVDFVETFVAMVQQGYYLDAGSENQPQDHLFKYVLLFKQPSQPVHQPVGGIKYKKITNFNTFGFLKNIQQAAIEGYDFNIATLLWGNPDKSIEVIETETTKKNRASLNKKPTKEKAPE